MLGMNFNLIKIIQQFGLVLVHLNDYKFGSVRVRCTLTPKNQVRPITNIQL